VKTFVKFCGLRRAEEVAEVPPGGAAGFVIGVADSPRNLSPEGAAELIGPASMRSPASLEGRGTQFIRVELAEGIDGHCARAEAAGARITQRPADQFYGARVYRALDPEGHVWNFDQKIADLSMADMEKASGLTIKTSLGG